MLMIRGMFDPNNVIQSLFRGKRFICQQNSKKDIYKKITKVS